MKEMLGVMLDCSRNAVMKPDVVKKFASLIRKMGYNTLMLYTEDTYEIESQPYFGHLRGRYTKNEIKDIDSFCKTIGIELIPCIQTLAHLENMFRWADEYSEINDCSNILLCGEEKTYELINEMLKTTSECFSSRKIHIGMDEAELVGTGKYQKKHGVCDRFNLINDHLHRVCDIAEKYGFEPMIWSDMFCQLALDIDNQYDDADITKIKEKAKLPKNISLVYWDYYKDNTEQYSKLIKTNKLFDRPLYFAGGAWAWEGFAPDNTFSLKATEAALKACREKGVDGIIMTIWGDNGSECSKFAVLPSLLHAAEYYNGNDDMEDIKKKFKNLTGCEFDDFMLFDRVNLINDRHQHDSAKYLLYNDPFLGIRDYKCEISDNMYYVEMSKRLADVKNRGEYGYLFEVYEKLTQVLSVKAALGVKTRKAYIEKDTVLLKEIVDEYGELIILLKEFHKLHQKRWFTENKPHGFDVQDIRLGGLMQRVLSCRERLQEYINGRTDSIPELEEPVLAKDAGTRRWNLLASVNPI